MSLSKFVKDREDWLHLIVANDDVLRPLLRAVFHKDEQFINEPHPHIGFSRDPSTLYNELSNGRVKHKLQKLKSKGIIKDDQWNLLFPTTQQTESKQFDITLLVVIIKNLCNIKTLNGKLNVQDLDPNDTTILGYVIKVLDLRNRLYHYGSTTEMIPQDKTDFWNELTNISNGLRYQGNLQNYKTNDLDPYWKPIIATWFQKQLDDVKEQVKDLQDKDDEFDKNNEQLLEDIENNKEKIEELNCLLQQSIEKNVDEKILKYVENFEMSMNKLQNDIDCLAARVSFLEVGQVKLNKEKEELKDNLQKIQTESSNQKKEVEERFSDAKEELTGIKIEVNEKFVASYQDASNQKKEVEERFSEVKEELTGIKTEINEKIGDNSRDHDLVTKGILDMVSDKIGDQASKLCCVHHWEDLEYRLEELQYNDLLYDIKQKDIITKGDYNCMKIFKNYRAEIYKRLKIGNKPEPVASKTRPSHRIINRKETFVELLTGPWKETYENDLEYFQENYENKISTIKRENIVQETDECIVVRGIAGIGKTTLMQSLLLDWTDESDKDMLNSFHLVIKIDCRELNLMTSIKCWQDISQRKYPKLFLNDLSHHTGVKKVLFIIDGIDEYRYLDDLVKLLNHKPADNSPANALYELINPNEDCFGLKKVALLCGRPKACADMVKYLHMTFSKVKCVEINGFNDTGVADMIKNFPFDNDANRETLSEISLNDQKLNAFMHIPVYAYAICTIFSNSRNADADLIKELNTSTKLNVALLLVHIRDHMLKDRRSLTDLVKDEEVIETIKEIASYAYKSLYERRIVFDEEELSPNKHLEGIERSGIIVKYENGEDGCLYQFSHLTLQELFVAIHMLCNKHKVTKDAAGDIDERNALLSHSLGQWNVEFMHFGLIGLYGNKNVPKYLSSFVENLNTQLTLETADNQLIDYLCFFKCFDRTTHSAIAAFALYEYHKEPNLAIKTAVYENIKYFQFYISSKLLLSKFCHFFEYYWPKHLKIMFSHKFEMSTDDRTKFHDSMKCFVKTQLRSPSKCEKFYISETEVDDRLASIIAPVLPIINEVNLSNSSGISQFGLQVIAKHYIEFCESEQSHLASSSRLESCSSSSKDRTEEWEGEKFATEYERPITSKLNISRCDVDDLKMSIIATMVPFIEEVVLGHCEKITKKGWKSVVQHVLFAKNNKTLRLKKLYVTDENYTGRFKKVMKPIIPLLYFYDPFDMI